MVRCPRPRPRRPRPAPREAAASRTRAAAAARTTSASSGGLGWSSLTSSGAGWTAACPAAGGGAGGGAATGRKRSEWRSTADASWWPPKHSSRASCTGVRRPNGPADVHACTCGEAGVVDALDEVWHVVRVRRRSLGGAGERGNEELRGDWRGSCEELASALPTSPKRAVRSARLRAPRGCKVCRCSMQERHVEPGVGGIADFTRRWTQGQPKATDWANGESVSQRLASAARLPHWEVARQAGLARLRGRRGLKVPRTRTLRCSCGFPVRLHDHTQSALHCRNGCRTPPPLPGLREHPAGLPAHNRGRARRGATRLCHCHA